MVHVAREIHTGPAGAHREGRETEALAVAQRADLARPAGVSAGATAARIVAYVDTAAVAARGGRKTPALPVVALLPGATGDPAPAAVRRVREGVDAEAAAGRERAGAGGLTGAPVTVLQRAAGDVTAAAVPPVARGLHARCIAQRLGGAALPDTPPVAAGLEGRAGLPAGAAVVHVVAEVDADVTAAREAGLAHRATGAPQTRGVGWALHAAASAVEAIVFEVHAACAADSPPRPAGPHALSCLTELGLGAGLPALATARRVGLRVDAAAVGAFDQRSPARALPQLARLEGSTGAAAAATAGGVTLQIDAGPVAGGQPDAAVEGALPSDALLSRATGMIARPAMSLVACEKRAVAPAVDLVTDAARVSRHAPPGDTGVAVGARGVERGAAKVRRRARAARATQQHHQRRGPNARAISFWEGHGVSDLDKNVPSSRHSKPEPVPSRSQTFSAEAAGGSTNPYTEQPSSRGSTTSNVVAPGLDSTEIVPPCASTSLRARGRPSPVPCSRVV